MSNKIDVTKIPEEFLHPACTQCIKDRTLKEDVLNQETKEVLLHKGTFPINCRGILNEAGYKAMAENITGEATEEEINEQVDVLRNAFDKVYWAKKNLNWEPRIANELFNFYPIQEVALNCTAKRKVYRLGRRMGKTDLMAIEASHCIATSVKDAASARRIGAKVTFITPAETQRKEIFDRIRAMLYEKMQWQKSIDVKRDTNSPYPEIVSANSAVIQGFVTGASSGSDGTSIRGKGGDKNFWDEAEFIRQEHYAIMMPLLAEDPNVELVVSSTPKEPNSIFFKFCKDPTYREFHFPSTALSFWTPQIDYDQRKFLGPIQYRQEILAEFGSVDESVFSADLRAAMFVNNKYEEVEKQVFKERDKYIIGLGVDWNGSQNGNQLCIMAREKDGQKKIIVNRLAIKGEEIQTRSINKIRELNQKWLFDFIYVDNGFGGVQIELLHKIAKAAIKKLGKDHPDSNLRKVKGINFQGKVKLKDPLTRKEESKFVKVFMVDTMLLEMEDANIVASKFDEELDEQMSAYQISRILESGAPKYQAGSKTIGDHALDAVMLASLGFRLEFGDLDPSVYFGHGMVLDPYEQLELEELLDRNNYVTDRPKGVLRNSYPSGNIKETLRPIDRTADLNRTARLQREQPQQPQIKREGPMRSNFSGQGRAISLRRR